MVGSGGSAYPLDVSAYGGGRFAESARCVRAYPAELPVLGDLLPSIMTPALVMNA